MTAEFEPRITRAQAPHALEEQAQQLQDESALHTSCADYWTLRGVSARSRRTRGRD